MSSVVWLGRGGRATENEAGDGGGAGLGQRRRALQKSLDLILQAAQGHGRGNRFVLYSALLGGSFLMEFMHLLCNLGKSEIVSYLRVRFMFDLPLYLAQCPCVPQSTCSENMSCLMNGPSELRRRLLRAGGLQPSPIRGRVGIKDRTCVYETLSKSQFCCLGAL